MTREDIEQINVAEPYCFDSDREEQWYNVGLKYGLDTADKHPKSPWISVKDDLPCNHQELMSSNDNNTTKLLCVCYENNQIGFDYMYKMFDQEWVWGSYTPKYWFAIPEPPKE